MFESELQMQNVSSEMLRDLFKFRETRSLIADSLKLETLSAQQVGFPSASDLDQWGHHADLRCTSMNLYDMSLCLVYIIH